MQQSGDTPINTEREPSSSSSSSPRTIHATTTAVGQTRFHQHPHRHSYALSVVSADSGFVDSEDESVIEYSAHCARRANNPAPNNSEDPGIAYRGDCGLLSVVPVNRQRIYPVFGSIRFECSSEPFTSPAPHRSATRFSETAAIGSERGDDEGKQILAASHLASSRCDVSVLAGLSARYGNDLFTHPYRENGHLVVTSETSGKEEAKDDENEDEDKKEDDVDDDDEYDTDSVNSSSVCDECVHVAAPHDHAHSTSHPATSTAGVPSHSTKSSTKSRKRCHNNGEGDSGPRRNKRGRNGRNNGGPTPPSNKGSTSDDDCLPCPYYIRAPQDYPACNLYFPTIHRLKEHIQRTHLKPHYCTRCGSRWGDRGQLDRHLEKCRATVVLEPPPTEVEIQMSERLKNRKIGSWNDIWQILFPGDTQVPDLRPASLPPPEEAGRPQSLALPEVMQNVTMEAVPRHQSETDGAPAPTSLSETYGSAEGSTYSPNFGAWTSSSTNTRGLPPRPTPMLPPSYPNPYSHSHYEYGHQHRRLPAASHPFPEEHPYPPESSSNAVNHNILRPAESSTASQPLLATSHNPELISSPPTYNPSMLFRPGMMDSIHDSITATTSPPSFPIWEATTGPMIATTTATTASMMSMTSESYISPPGTPRDFDYGEYLRSDISSMTSARNSQNQSQSQRESQRESQIESQQSQHSQQGQSQNDSQ